MKAGSHFDMFVIGFLLLLGTATAWLPPGFHVSNSLPLLRKKHALKAHEFESPAESKKSWRPSMKNVFRSEGTSAAATTAPKADFLLPPPSSSAMGSFFENNVTGFQMPFIQCQMIAVANIGGEEYGVGLPIDTPVAITRFTNKTNLQIVTSDNYEHSYEDLVDYIQRKLEDEGDLQLIHTPMVLTLSGELDEEDEDDEENKDTQDELSSNEEDEEDITFEDIVDYEDELLAEEGDVEVDSYDEEADIDSFVDDTHASETPAIYMIDAPEDVDMQTLKETVAQLGLTNINTNASYSIFRPKHVDMSQVDPDAFVTAEDEKQLLRAHKRADRLFDYIADMKLIGSFQFRKQNFHLVQLLEPIMLFGRRMVDRRGYNFQLLNATDTEQIRPRLEALLSKSPTR